MRALPHNFLEHDVSELDSELASIVLFAVFRPDEHILVMRIKDSGNA
jgi:hypothetical protein